jgi:hypothetical protein
VTDVRSRATRRRAFRSRRAPSHDPTWIGAFAGAGRAEVLFYSPGDHNWWLGSTTSGVLHWFLTGQGVR